MVYAMQPPLRAVRYPSMLRAVTALLGLLAAPLPCRGWPVQLLAPADEAQTKLKVVESGLRAIELLQGPIATVAVVGPYHSGKSFMLNNLAGAVTGQGLQTSSSGAAFQVGQSVDPATRGIWAHHVGRVALGEDRGEADLVLLDTEGFAVANVSESYDGKIFASSAVLSSLLLYNTMHIIDAKDLEYLDLLAHNTQLFALKTSTIAGQDSVAPPLAPNTTHTAHREPASPEDLFTLPPVVWTVQAFTLNLQGETCTSWLQRMLEGAVATAPHPHQRLGLGSLFPSIHCHTLYLPASSRSALHHLGNVTQAQLTQEFCEDVESVSSSILSQLRPKTRGGRPLAGADFSAMTRIIVDALNQGVLSDIPSRWNAFEKHLKMSSVRAAVGHFEAEVSKAFRNRSVPLASPAMTTLVANVRIEAIQLVPRLLVGLDSGMEKAAIKEVERHIKELDTRLVSENQKAIRDFVRSVRVAMDERDTAHVAQQNATLLPLPSATLFAFCKEREDTLAKDFRVSSLAYQGDSFTGRELRELMTKSTARSRRLKDYNTQVMDSMLRRVEAGVFKRYADSLESAVGEAPVVPSRIDELHKITVAQAKTRLTEEATNFQHEPQFRATLTRLSASMTAHVKALHQLNVERTDRFCKSVRVALLLNATDVAKTQFHSTDEHVVESTVQSLMKLEGTFPLLVSPHERTSECRRHGATLHADMAALHRRQRDQLAANLRDVFHEPLQEICKVVVEAQCRQYWSVSTLRHFVHRECGKWVRRSAMGASLTEPTLHSVLNLFLEKDVGACIEEVRQQEARYNSQWRRFVAVAGLLGLAAAIVYLGARSKLD